MIKKAFHRIRLAAHNRATALAGKLVGKKYPSCETEVTPTDVVIDTNILLDMLFVEREHHAAAIELRELLTKRGSNVLLPAHSLFEMVNVAFKEHQKKGRPFTWAGIAGSLVPPRTILVTLDTEFVDRYLTRALRRGHVFDVKGGPDMIFVAVALEHSITLITEDARMLNGARRMGVTTMTISEFIAAR